MNKKYLGLTSIGTVAIAFALTTASLTPTGAGNYSAWTPSTGTTHYTLVNEATCNGTTNYVSTSVNGNRDSYAISLSSVPNGAIIRGVAVAPCASKTTTSGSVTLGVFYRLNGVNSADINSFSLSGTKPVELGSASYTGLSVTKNASTTFEIGAVLASGTTGARLSRLSTVITYITTVPNTPTLTAVASSSSNIALSWSVPNNDQDGFFVEKSTDGVNFVALATTTAVSRSYLDTGLTSGTYYYKIRGYNPFGYSGYSSTTMTVLP